MSSSCRTWSLPHFCGWCFTLEPHTHALQGHKIPQQPASTLQLKTASRSQERPRTTSTGATSHDGYGCRNPRQSQFPCAAPPGRCNLEFAPSVSCNCQHNTKRQSDAWTNKRQGACGRSHSDHLCILPDLLQQLVKVPLVLARDGHVVRHLYHSDSHRKGAKG
jgi:hypothetical protein